MNKKAQALMKDAVDLKHYGLRKALDNKKYKWAVVAWGARGWLLRQGWKRVGRIWKVAEDDWLILMRKSRRLEEAEAAFLRHAKELHERASREAIRS